MRHETRTETNDEQRALGFITLACYSATLAAMLTCGYTLLGLAVRAAGQELALMRNLSCL